ncbi:hypothetical protein MTR_8g005315 [Medicago truncatula]|uniref:Uncharacterized protein n=1 Tax=Medicago truncatula TaxID=3880 RepID=A0A072TJS7_MEDTR|nr:hypothetical protein MTR_8g005315 [Medicago truncatula]
MAPKSAKKVVVRSTRKVVQESVQVYVLSRTKFKSLINTYAIANDYAKMLRSCTGMEVWVQGLKVRPGSNQGSTGYCKI